MNTDNKKLFYQRLSSYFEGQEDSFIRKLSENPQSCFFINEKKGNKEEILSLIDFPSRPFLHEKAYSYDFEKIGKTKAYEMGLIYPQDSESSFPVSFIDPENVHTAIDLCAAPGGKTINARNVLSDDVLFFANEVSYKRISALSSNLERCGFCDTLITNAPVSVLSQQLYGYFDLVLLDAPCSGEGMMRKYSEILENYNIGLVEECAKTQKELLEDAYLLLKKGGQLLYSTCTYATEEDEDQIGSFLDRHKDMVLVPIHFTFNYSRLEGTIKLCPLNDSEGQFMALMIKTSEAANAKIVYQKTVHNRTVENWISENLSVSSYYLYQTEDRFYFSFHPLPFLKGNIVSDGIYLGQLLKNRFEPSHMLYRSNILRKDFKYVFDLNDRQYEDFISGKELKADIDDHHWLLTYHGFSIGFGKAVKGVLKNKYPKGLRRVL